MKFIVSYSGGKDSLATLLYVMENFTISPIVVFCDTGWEHEKTYQHIKDVGEQTGIKFTVLKSDKYNGFADLSIKKKRVASTKARFCTEELKIKPMIDFILSQNDNCIIFQGIRKQESFNRSKMQAECTYFKYYFIPRKIDKKGKPVYDTYRKKDVIKWLNDYTADIIRPIFNWDVEKVFEYAKSKGFEPNPLYKEGFSRIGCFPCIMCRQREIKLIAEKYPEHIGKIRNVEKTIGRTFFGPDYINNKQIAFIDDVVKQVSDDPNQIDLIPKEHKSCESIYNICE